MVFGPLDPLRFADHVGEWLQNKGPDSDVVVSCRVRLARNVQGYPFVVRLKPESAEELCQNLRPLFADREEAGETIWVGMDQAPPVVRLLLRERHLVSRDLAPTDPRLTTRPGRAVTFNEDETFSVMINEEDHLRLQSLSAGLSLRAAWERVRDLDLSIEDQVGFAYSDELGYLTGCPTNVGTGLRASVMLHLPALGLVRKELEKVFTAAQRTGLAVRGMYGEGSRAAGDFYQISNQVTLGRTEEELIGDLEALVPCIVDFERRVREVLYEEQASGLEDRVSRSQGMLRTARSLPTDVALLHLSNVRLGACLGILPGIAPVDVNRMAIQIQKAHVHTLAGKGAEDVLADPTERDRMRAAYLRRRFSELSG
jgi:protein arginine kinase